MPIKIYISQANQQNPGPGGYLERVGCNAIIRAAAKIFETDSRFAVKIAPFGDAVRNTATENADAANAWGADYYVAVHSNASGVKDRPAKGTVVFYYSGSPAGKRLARALYDAIAPLSPGSPDHGIQAHDGFIEIHRPHAPAVLVELEGHDWITGVKWLTTQRRKIGRALYEGICTGIGLKPLTGRSAVDWRPLKREAVKVADLLGIARDEVVVSVKKGTAFEKLLHAIADYKE